MTGSVEVHDDPITVRKSVVEFDTDEVVGIEFRIRSEADTPVAFRLVETLPDGVSTSEVGLHPDYRAEDWTVFPERNRIVFQGRIDPDEEVVTRWGIRTATRDGLDPFLREPTVEMTYPIEADTGGAAAATRDDGASADEDDSEWEFESGADAGDGGLVSGLLGEIQRGEADDDELALLRDELGIETPESQRIRTRYLQSTVDELAAYADEFEAFVDGEGPPGELVEEFRDGLDALETRLDDLEAERATADERWMETRERVAALESGADRLERIEDDLHRIRYELEAIDEARGDGVEERLDSLEAEVDDAVASLRTDVDALREEVERGKAWRERLSELVGETPERERP